MSRPTKDCVRCDGRGYVIVSVLTLRYGAQSTECSCPECCTPTPSHLQRWRDEYRWQPDTDVCRHCGESTHLRDRRDLPAHWLCAAKAAHMEALR